MLHCNKGCFMLHCSNRAHPDYRGFAMNDQVLDTFKGQSAKLLAPSNEINKLAIAKFEQLASLQLASLREYSDLNFSQLKAASNIASAEDLKEYFGKQQDFLKTVGEKLAADAQAMAALGKEFTEEAKKITFKGFAATTKA
jgi:phasin family protein